MLTSDRIKPIRTVSDFNKLFLTQNLGRSKLKDDVIIKIYWDQCGSCHRFAPFFTQLSEFNERYKYYEIERKDLIPSGLIAFLKKLENEYIDTQVRHGTSKYDAEISAKRHFRFPNMFPTVIRMYNDNDYLFVEILDAPIFKDKGEEVNTIEYLKEM